MSKQSRAAASPVLTRLTRTGPTPDARHGADAQGFDPDAPEPPPEKFLGLF